MFLGFQDHRSGFFHHQEKKVRKPWFLTLVLFCDFFYEFLSLNTAINAPSVSKKQKNTLFFVDILKAADEKSRSRIWIRIRIRNSVYGSTDPDQDKNVNTAVFGMENSKRGSPLVKDDNVLLFSLIFILCLRPPTLLESSVY
jgi:hypothetical protein